MNKFYFTFGSDENYPYQNTYLIVVAFTLKKAIEVFQKKYPKSAVRRSELRVLVYRKRVGSAGFSLL